MIIAFTFCWSVKGGQGPPGPAIPSRSLGRRPRVDSGLGLRCLVSGGGEVSGVAYVVDEVGGRDVRSGVVCGVVEGLGVHLRFPFRLVTTALCRGARRGVNGTRGAPAGVAWTVDVPACAVACCVKEPIGRGKRRWTPGPGPRHRPGLVGWMPSPSRFVDGGHVDACVELSGLRWLYVSTSTALAGIRRLVAGVLANMDSAFGRL